MMTWWYWCVDANVGVAAAAAAADDNSNDVVNAGDGTVLQIDMEEYGVALDLARKYSLDSDLVYQRQWRNTPVSVTSIQDYLVSIQLWLYTIWLFCNFLPL